MFFAYAYPYTYTDLTEDLTAIEKDSRKSTFMTRNVLCRTIAGNKCEYLTVTAKNHPDVSLKENKQNTAKTREKRSVFQCTNPPRREQLQLDHERHHRFPDERKC